MLFLVWVQCTWVAWSEITYVIASSSFFILGGVLVFVLAITPNHIHNIVSTRIQPLWCRCIISHLTCFLMFVTILLLGSSEITFTVIYYFLCTRRSLCRLLMIRIVIWVIIGWSFSTLICLKWHITHTVRLLALVILTTLVPLVIMSSILIVLSIITLSTSLVIWINLCRLWTVICVLLSLIICIVLVATLFLLIVVIIVILTLMATLIISIITMVLLPTLVATLILVIILTVVFMLHKSKIIVNNWNILKR